MTIAPAVRAATPRFLQFTKIQLASRQQRSRIASDRYISNNIPIAAESNLARLKRQFAARIGAPHGFRSRNQSNGKPTNSSAARKMIP